MIYKTDDLGIIHLKIDDRTVLSLSWGIISGYKMTHIYPEEEELDRSILEPKK